MNIQFFDRQDRSNPRNGVKLADPDEVLVWLDQMRSRPPFFCELVGENGFNLLVGVGDARGCAQYSAGDGSPPYLMAVGNEREDDETFMEYLTANTDTPVPMKFCLPMEQIKKIVAYFVGTGERSPAVSWEEI
jgi:hypothetical protein